MNDYWLSDLDRNAVKGQKSKWASDVRTLLFGNGIFLDGHDLDYFLKTNDPNAFLLAVLNHIRSGTATQAMINKLNQAMFNYWFGISWHDHIKHGNFLPLIYKGDIDVMYLSTGNSISIQDRNVRLSNVTINNYVFQNQDPLITMRDIMDIAEEDVSMFDDDDYEGTFHEWLVNNLTDHALQAHRNEPKFKNNYTWKCALKRFDSEKKNKKVESKDSNKNQNNEGNIMEKVKDIGSAVINANKDAAMAVAEITVGKAALKASKKLIKPRLPMYVRGYADSPLFDVVIANLVQIAVEARFKDNDKVRKISKAMMTASALTVAEHFDIDGMIEEFIDGISLPKGMSLDDLEG